MRAALLPLQLLVVVFLALHDWISLGKLNDMEGPRAMDTTRKWAAVTLLGAAPFAIGFAASAR
jgi:hypothetical protein